MMDSDVIAINVCRWPFFDGRIEVKPDAPFEFFLKSLGGPAMFEEQKLEPGPFPVLAQLFTVAENLGDSLQDRKYLVALHKSIEPHRKMRIGREAATDPQ